MERVKKKRLYENKQGLIWKGLVKSMYLVFIKWRTCKHCFKNELTLTLPRKYGCSQNFAFHDWGASMCTNFSCYAYNSWASTWFLPPGGSISWNKITDLTQCMKQHIFPSTLFRLSVFSSKYCHYTEHFYLMNLIW